MPNKRLTIGIVAVAVVVVLAVSLNAYFIRIDSGGWALWNGNEAYLFIATDILGRHVKWIGYPFLVVSERLGRIEPPDDSGGSMYVVRVTSAGVERHVLELVDRRPGSGPSMYTPLEGRIWVNYPTFGGLCWWAGDHFERATQEELQRLNGINHLNNKTYRDQSGWSKDMVGERPLTMSVGDEFELLVRGQSLSERHGAVSVELQKVGHEPAMVFNLDVGAGRVSRTEYRNAFHYRD